MPGLARALGVSVKGHGHLKRLPARWFARRTGPVPGPEEIRARVEAQWGVGLDPADADVLHRAARAASWSVRGPSARTAPGKEPAP